MAESVLDLKVWKELAIKKQILIKAATDALGLDPECSEEELRAALGQGIKRISEAESLISAAKDENHATIACMEKKLGASETKCSEYEALSSELQAEKQALQALLDTTRTNSASELKRANAQLDEKKKR